MEKIEDLIKKLKPTPIIIDSKSGFVNEPVDDIYIAGNTPFLKKILFPSDLFSFVDGSFENVITISDEKFAKISFVFKSEVKYKLHGFESISDYNICKLVENNKNHYKIEIIFLISDEIEHIRNIKIIMINSYNSRKHIPLKFKIKRNEY